MAIKVARTSGFCFGVDRAVGIVYDNIKKYPNLKTLGPIIHNDSVINDLKSKGVSVCDDVYDLKNDDVVIIRTHGISKADYDYLNEHQILYIDATCPYVKKIHKIVSDEKKAGKKIIIVGDKTHPEVTGINGWCDNEAVIIGSADEVSDELSSSDGVCIVAQTTINRRLWDDVIQKFDAALTFDTICSATNERQTEAELLARQSDAMVVIGGSESSNTKKLYDICLSHCKDTVLIETADALPGGYSGKNVGITAGASTPAYIIKEVVKKMTEENIQNPEISDFEQELEKTFKILNTGDIVTGTVIGITPTEIHVNLGAKSDGYIPVSDMTGDPNVNPAELVKVGDEIEVFVVRVSDVEGVIQLSMKKLETLKGRKIIEQAMEDGETLHGRVIEAVNGGVIMSVHSAKVFIPASLCGRGTSGDLSQLLGQEFPVKIIDVNLKRNKIVGSIRAATDEHRNAKSKELWEGIEKGKRFSGVVKSLTSFGAFVDIGGADGLVHISELSWGRIKHPSEVVKVGDIMDVYVKDLDREAGKISLGYKNPESNPWEKVKALNVGDVVKCKIVRLVPFGAFAEIFENVDGLIHISQISDKRIGKPSDALSLGQEVEAKITEINNEAQKISISIRALIQPEVEPEVADESVLVYSDDTAAEVVVEEAAPVITEEPVEEAIVPAGEEAAAQESEAVPEIVEEPVEETAPVEEEVVAEESEAAPEIIEEPAEEIVPTAEEVVVEEDEAAPEVTEEPAPVEEEAIAEEPVEEIESDEAESTEEEQ